MGINLQHQKRFVFHWMIYIIPLLLTQTRMKFKIRFLFLFKVGSIILTKYFEVLYGGDLIVDTTALIAFFFFWFIVDTTALIA